MPRVSVIMPTYNRSQLLALATESVVRQTINDLELIIVDDASHDDTQLVCRELLSRDTRVKYIRVHENSRTQTPQTEPRNVGLAAATGEFIAYLDDDNMWCPDFLETMITALESKPLRQLAYCNSVNYYSHEEKQEVLARDGRVLAGEREDWAVFKSDLADVKYLGEDGYIDANEIVHRRGILGILDGPWRIEHPRRQEIMRAQGWIRPQRRFNDLDLVERVIEALGREALLHVDHVRVHFFYPSHTSPRSGLCLWPLACGCDAGRLAQLA